MTREELQSKYPDKSFGVIKVRRDYKRPFTGTIDQWGHKKIDYSVNAQIIDEGWWEIYLDHSCDEWEIGVVDHAKEFRENLDKAIKYCEELN